MVRGCTRLHANQARRQVGKELENLRSADTLADHYCTVRINAVNLKDRLRNIDTDCANLTQ
jgi:hypothetical protein